jgi:hypothetical protein
MTIFPSRRRCLQYLAGLVCAAVLAVVWIHVQQHILRSRAERLLADLRSLQLRKATFEEAQVIFKRWERWGDYKEPWYGAEQQCTAERCAFNVTLGDPLATLVWHYDLRVTLRGWWFDAYKAVGGRYAVVRAFIRVRNGVVTPHGFLAGIDPPEGTIFGASVRIVPRLYPVSRYWPELSSGQEYGVALNKRCDTCDIGMDFTPYARPEDIERLTNVNLGCLTAWNPCRVQRDLYPAAVAELHVETDNWVFRPPEEFTCSPMLIERIARDTENVAIADLIGIENHLPPVQQTRPGPSTPGRLMVRPRPDWFITLRIMERLKNATLWEVGALGRLKIRDFGELGDLTKRNSGQATPGQKAIVLFGYKRDEPQATEPWLEVCGALPLSEENLALVRRGIAQDERPD